MPSTHYLCCRARPTLALATLLHDRNYAKANVGESAAKGLRVRYPETRQRPLTPFSVTSRLTVKKIKDIKHIGCSDGFHSMETHFSYGTVFEYLCLFLVLILKLFSHSAFATYFFPLTSAYTFLEYVMMTCQSLHAIILGCKASVSEDYYT